jgi:hypothetical protein
MVGEAKLSDVKRENIIAGAVAVMVAVALFVGYQVFYAHDEPKYQVLQRFIDEAYTSRGMDVSKVTCTPPVRFVAGGRTYHLTCVVDFGDGTTYNATGTIISPWSRRAGGEGGPVRYRWTRP